jgi:hypothetical protein
VLSGISLSSRHALRRSRGAPRSVFCIGLIRLGSGAGKLGEVADAGVVVAGWLGAEGAGVVGTFAGAVFGVFSGIGCYLQYHRIRNSSTAATVSSSICARTILTFHFMGSPLSLKALAFVEIRVPTSVSVSSFT